MVKGMAVLLEGPKQVEERVDKNIMKIQKDKCKVEYLGQACPVQWHKAGNLLW